MPNSKSKKFQKELDELITKGRKLLAAIQYECGPKAFLKAYTTKLGEEGAAKAIASLPNFSSDYQTWYSEAQAVIKQVLPDRYKDFISYYEYSKVRKEITFENYLIRDYLQGLEITRSISNEVVVGGDAAIPEFSQQLSILKAASATLQSSLLNMTAILQADLFDTEIDSARALLKSGFLRAAGAICGVVIEKHLKKICEDHKIVVRKKNPAISDLSQLLRDNEIINLPQWRFNQHLADIRNISDHAKDREPTIDEITDLIDGSDKILKTIF